MFVQPLTGYNVNADKFYMNWSNSERRLCKKNSRFVGLVNSVFQERYANGCKILLRNTQFKISQPAFGKAGFFW